MGTNADAVEPAPSKASLWEDFVDIFYAPSSVFARRADGKFGMALLLLIVLGTILVFLTKNAMQPIFDSEFARQARRRCGRIPTSPRSRWHRAATSSGCSRLSFRDRPDAQRVRDRPALWLVAKLFDAKESLAAGIMIATYSEVPRIVQILVNAAQALFMSPEKLNAINSVDSTPLASWIRPRIGGSNRAGESIRYFVIWDHRAARDRHLRCRKGHEAAGRHNRGDRGYLARFLGLFGALRSG
jgi:hypothetical protein